MKNNHAYIPILIHIRALSKVEGLFQYGAIGRAISYQRSAISSQPARADFQIGVLRSRRIYKKHVANVPNQRDQYT
ncbi:MAG TPA: hypothetical protein VLY84_09155 [Dysgonamonadaceae bacterium]|nr:hypothetical protein [Dysgonamonadaceae bacterium]